MDPTREGHAQKLFVKLARGEKDFQACISGESTYEMSGYVFRVIYPGCLEVMCGDPTHVQFLETNAFLSNSRHSSSFFAQGSGGEGKPRKLGEGCKAGDKEAGLSGGSSCPVIGLKDSDGTALDPRNRMPVAKSTNEPSEGQRLDLGRDRTQSTIPMAASTSKPVHQSGAEGNYWVYPSEQMFYNAMKRKGWDPREEDMHTVVKIHNAVNERAWNQVVEWERRHANECGAPTRLVKFVGKPKEFSPKALFMNFLGYKLPFDRHDWIVDRCGREVRYVIDFYNAAPLPGMPVAMHLDVRPALDSPGAAWDRLSVFTSAFFKDLRARIEVAARGAPARGMTASDSGQAHQGAGAPAAAGTASTRP